MFSYISSSRSLDIIFPLKIAYGFVPSKWKKYFPCAVIIVGYYKKFLFVPNYLKWIKRYIIKDLLFRYYYVIMTLKCLLTKTFWSWLVFFNFQCFFPIKGNALLLAFPKFFFYWKLAKHEIWFLVVFQFDFMKIFYMILCLYKLLLIFELFVLIFFYWRHWIVARIVFFVYLLKDGHILDIVF